MSEKFSSFDEFSCFVCLRRRNKQKKLPSVYLSVPKNTEAHRNIVPAGKLKRESWGFGNELPAPLVRRRHRIIHMCLLTDALTHTRSCVDESALGRPRLSDGPCRSHDVEQAGALALSFFNASKSAMRLGALLISRSHSRRYQCPEWVYTVKRVNAIFSLCYTVSCVT